MPATQEELTVPDRVITGLLAWPLSGQPPRQLAGTRADLAAGPRPGRRAARPAGSTRTASATISPTSSPTPSGVMEKEISMVPTLAQPGPPGRRPRKRLTGPYQLILRS